jgi:hypothetical protein
MYCRFIPTTMAVIDEGIDTGREFFRRKSSG